MEDATSNAVQVRDVLSEPSSGEAMSLNLGAFEHCTVTITSGSVRDYEPSAWADALVIVISGTLRVDTAADQVATFEMGSMIPLAHLRVRGLTAVGQEPVTLQVIRRSCR